MATLHFERQRRWFSLPVLISVGLVLAAVVPLIILLTFTNVQTRPALITQANKAMASDAQTRTELLDNYFTERVSDAYTLTQVPVVQTFLTLPNIPTSAPYQASLPYVYYALMAGINKDHNYTTWTLFDPTGQVRLSYPKNPAPHGQSLVPPDALQVVNAGKPFVSPVYYSPETHMATMEFYAPIFAPTPPGATQPSTQEIGFMRSTLKLDYIWNSIVQTDLGNNGNGSYAFILDEHGVRIADTDTARRFHSVEPLPGALQQQIQQEQRYGTSDATPLLADPGIATSRHHSALSEIFQEQPAQQSQLFQVARQSTQNAFVHWNYYVLSPVNTVTAVANQELLNTVLVAIIASLLVAIIGLYAGQRLTRPIMKSVENLRQNSYALSTLASGQQDAAAEQIWVVDSSQIGLQSVQYYTDAAKIALRQLRESTMALAQYWVESDPARIEGTLERILRTVDYLENAADYQSGSNQKLATALKVATQVTEQLNAGAASATEAATQLEEVVKKLRAVVGR